ncbi:MAG: tetratricopeptide repeat protein [Candidatus Sericytochromatia bacterium]|nr:tetratricopeptide repeat protein [Candidatus Sericytochromatia bacterium]
MALRIAKVQHVKTPAMLQSEAYAALERDDRPGAIAKLLDLLEQRPEDAKAYLHLATLLTGEGQLDRALLAAREALRLEPDEADACNVVGVVMFQLGWIRTAALAFRQALALQADHPGAKRNLLACVERERDGQLTEEPEELASIRALLDRRPPRLSLCMIVKNEEAFLDACLSSVRGVVDEICLVDTGSTDGTVAIAEAHGARIAHHPWTGDFSEARNKALEMATGDWILVLDADEELSAESRTLLRETLKRKDCGAFDLVIDNALGQGTAAEVQRATVIRLFRNTPEMRYTGRIHEQILPALHAHGIRIGTVPVLLTHKGYTDEMMADRKKDQRNLDLLLQQEQELGQPQPYNQFNLGQQYKRMGQPELAERHFRTALEVLQATDPDCQAPYHAPLLYGLIQLLKERGETDEALEWAEKATRIFPEAANLLHQLAVLRLAKGEVDPCIELLDRVMALADVPFAGGTDIGVFGYLNDATRGVCLARKGRLADARRLFERALAATPKADPATEVNLAMVEIGMGDEAEAVERLSRIVSSHPEEPKGWMLLGQHMARLGHLSEALALYGKALEHHPGLAELVHERADLLLRSGRAQDAIGVLEAHLAQAPEDRRGRISLGVSRLVHGDLTAGTDLALAAAKSPDPETRRAWMATAHVLSCCAGEAPAPEALEALRFRSEDVRAQWQGLLRTLLDHGCADAAEQMLRAQARHEAIFPGLGRDLATVLLAAGFDDPALALLLAHREAHPEDALGYFHLARVCLVRNLHADGVEMLQEAIRLDPGLASARRLLVKMRQLARTAALTEAATAS